MIPRALHRNSSSGQLSTFGPGTPYAENSEVLYAYEMTCTYKQGVNSKCANNVLKYKEAFLNETEEKGTLPLQYYNTAQCDGQPFMEKLFHPEVYEWMLRTKMYWDPNNRFNHCYSVGSTQEDCCPDPK